MLRPVKKYLYLFFILLSLNSFLASICYASDSSLIFNDAEKEFIKDHPIIKLGVDPLFVPFEFIDKNGEYKGIAADYLALISQRTGIKFEVVKDLSWPQAYEMALNKEVDLLPAIGKSQEREEHFIFSQAYYSFKRVIVTQDTDSSITDMDDLNGMTVAVQRNSSHHSDLLAYPNINLSLYNSIDEALAAVATGQEKAFLGNLASTTYLIRSNGLTNLRFISYEPKVELGLYFAAQKDMPELITIIDKVLNSIDDADKNAIHNKWVGIEQEIDYGPLIRIISALGFLVAIVMSVSFYWIARLKKEVKTRKLIQIDLEKAKKEADEANKFKSGFMARMSHEIRTPLNAITGMTYLLKKTNLDLTQEMYADRISQASSNMINIINDILDFSKIEAGKVELENISFNIDQVIYDVVNIVSYKIEEQEIGFKLSKDPLLPSWFFGDPKRIQQVLLNILNNATKFTSQGEVSLDIRLLAKENEKYHISFTIKDTGIGMTEDQVKKLFIPYNQADTSINRRFGGSGLGLSIVNSLVEMMGGQIRVFSTPGEGSTFIINLSLPVDEDQENAFRITLTAGQFKDIRTLVLEKTGSDTNLIGSYLEAFGMKCELTTSQDSAMNLLEGADGKSSKPFDLVIIDYETPSEGGFEFVQAIRNNEKIIKKPRFIMLFPMMREDLFNKLKEYNILIGIGKPLIPSILLNGILDIFKLKAVSTSELSIKRETAITKFDKPRWALIVEDNKTNQLIAQTLLKQIGIESITAFDGKMGLDLYKQYMDKIDIILMDLHMPVMNGYEAAREIRKISTGVPIVAMTADVISGVRERCRESGMNHFISKPFDPDKFIHEIKDIIMTSDAKNIHETKVLDRKEGIKNLGGSSEIYRLVLREYFYENQDVNTKLLLAIRDKKYTEASQIVHKLKSSSGSIGAKKLYDLSVSLQKALNEKREEEISSLHAIFSDTLNKLFVEIENILDEEQDLEGGLEWKKF